MILWEDGFSSCSCSHPPCYSPLPISTTVVATCTDRCLTDPNEVGGEKVAITYVHPSIAAPTFHITASDVAVEVDGMLSPSDVFIVKGWSRGVAALTLCLAAYECHELNEASPCNFAAVLFCAASYVFGTSGAPRNCESEPRLDLAHKCGSALSF